MPQRTRIHQDRPLTEISNKYRNARLIADALVPAVPVKFDTDTFYTYTKDNLRDEETLWGKGARAGRTDFEVSTSSYTLERHALETQIPDEDRQNADPAIQLDIDTTESLTDKLMLQKEKSLADLVGAAANWSNVTSLTSTLAWSANTTLSNPILFVDSACSVIAQNTGKLPNTVVLDDRTWRAAKEHTSIVDRIKYVSSDSVGPDLLAKLFNVDRLFVAGGIENTGQEGLADSLSFIWTDMAHVGYYEMSPGLRKVSALYQFQKRGMGGAMQTFRYREEETESDVVRVKTKYQFRAIASDAAYLIANTVQ